jgi:hypothetical protein
MAANSPGSSIMRLGAHAAVSVLSLLVALCELSAVADPPSHAPAHGWRKKHDPYYVGYSGQQWERDFDISSGTCNRQAVATVLGGVAGGVIVTCPAIFGPADS